MAERVMERRRATKPVPTARLSYAFLVVGGLTVLASELLPTPRLVQDAVYSILSLAVVAAILVGVRRYAPRSGKAWIFMACGQASWVIADTTFNWQQDVMHVDAFPTFSDGFYLAGYPLLAVGLGMLVKDRAHSRRDLGPLLDSATVTAGLCLLSWVLLARPTIASLHHSPGAAAVAAAYPAMDILLVGALVRLLSTPGGRSPAFRMLLGALVLLITADTLSVAFDLFATNTVSVVEYLWLFSYVAWGAAALHPSMTTLSDSVSKPDVHFRGVRLLAVVLATLIAPSLLAMHEVTGVPVDVWAVIIGSVVMFLLVVVRMSLAIEQIAYAHEALEKLQDELAVQATHDPLTGLANRTQSMRLLAGALGRARRRRSTVGLLFIDLDGFKGVNDNNGHRTGDEVLRHVARRMSQQVREVDFVARLGGDEFVVGVEDVLDEASVVTLAHRLIAAISQPIQVSEDLTVQVGASVGIALGRGGETDVETLLHEADLAVYRAKAAGRGCAELFSWTARAALKERNELERALVGAIADNELVLHFQPIVDTETGRVDCFEALVRWDRPGFGLLPPDEFLPVAESSDLICQLDTWVLREAVAQLSRWNRMRGDRELKVAVNVSGRHVSQHRIQSDVAGALRVSTVDPGQLVIEVTETALMDGSVAATNLEALRKTGVIVSLDDFGTGYQSSAQLSRLPVDVLKIDRRFVDTSSAAARSLLELMVKAAHAFGAEVVAEGVENEEELAFARAIGCEYVQGFHIARPAPADQLEAADVDRELAG
ncbi:putative bifunctional diguanylate cyclase/phosphodiesterase [Nocardioides pocheonensis]|uniref:EAL domain-containing protein n=1 Tax=Nocardioides pocheonensis TaxID=661485 RepID=A0A3N0GTC9_9ACTN|nr:EAL domain-containing protein [Nocardioides pocheonensis]RNM15725.1 EAL domain-containing protein [Nocardioides pocheonensis]